MLTLSDTFAQRDIYLAGYREAVLSVMMSPVAIQERYEIRLRREFDTACWTWQPPHRIYLGDRMLSGARPGLNHEQLVQYAASYIRHEMCHLLWTERDMDKINKALRKTRAPFALFNMFEDARIEHRCRKEMGLPFNWMEYEGIQPRVASASEMFYVLIQSENQVERSSLSDYALRVFDYYYPRACRARDSMALIPLIRAWQQEFPDDVNARGEGQAQGARGHDLNEAGDLQGAPAGARQAKVERLESESEALDGKGGGVGEENVDIESEGTGDLLADEAFARLPDPARVRRIVNRLRLMMEKPARTTTTEAPGKRVSVRHAALGDWRYRQKTARGRDRRRFDLVLDCSGSMSGAPMEEARILVAAFNELARDGLLEGHLILSVVVGAALYQRFTFPLPDAVVSRLHGYGRAEGLESALRRNIAELRRAERVFVFTDANICDTPINQKVFHEQGLFPCGLYVGKVSACTRMSKYFPEHIVRETAERLAEAMLERHRKKSRK